MIYSTLTNIDHNRAVDMTTDNRFVHNLKIGLLLALREQELLTDQQLRLALKNLGGAL